MPFSGPELGACQEPRVCGRSHLPTDEQAGSRELPGGAAADDASRCGRLNRTGLRAHQPAKLSGNSFDL
jgi:hypothetical protein